MSSPRAQAGRQRRRLTATEVDLERIRQRALLVSAGSGAESVEDAEASLVELALLTDTAGADPIESVLQRRRTPDPKTYLGKGKADELRELVNASDIDVVIVDDELTPSQQRTLETLFKVDVVDRVALILDIFAQHATSQEGRVQVELAQLRYRFRGYAAGAPSSASRARASEPEDPVRRSSRSTAGACSNGSNASNAR